MRGDVSTPVSDHELAARLRIGDLAAQAVLLRQYGARLFGFIRWRLEDAVRGGAEADAKELLNATFYDVITKIDLFDPARGTLKAWLFTIAKNKIIDHLRKKARKSEPPIANGVELSALKDPGTDPNRAEEAESASRSERIRAVREAMVQLSEKDRVILELGYFVQAADADVARRIGVQPQSIPMLRKRARERLKKRLVARPEFREWM